MIRLGLKIKVYRNGKLLRLNGDYYLKPGLGQMIDIRLNNPVPINGTKEVQRPDMASEKGIDPILDT